MTFKQKELDLIEKAEQEFEYVADPSQCGVIVRRHFNGIMIAIYVFIALFMLAAITSIYIYSHH